MISEKKDKPKNLKRSSLKEIKIRKSPDFIPSKNLKKEMEKRNKLRSTYFLNKTEENKKAFTMQRNKVNKLVNDEKRTQQLKK